MPLSDTSRKIIQNAQRHMPFPRASLLFALRTVQSECGQVGGKEVEELAALFDLAPAQIEGVARFYDLITQEQTYTHRFRLCEGVVCAMMHADSLWLSLQEMTAQGAIPQDTITLERTACIGHCDHAPAALFDELLVGPVKEEELASLLSGFIQGGEGHDQNS